MAMSSIVIAASTASTFSCRRNFSVFLFQSWKQKKTHRERSGEYRGFFSVPRTEKNAKIKSTLNFEAIQAAAKMELTAILKEAFTSCFQDLQKRWQQSIDC
jgi:hypothetical protein